MIKSIYKSNITDIYSNSQFISSLIALQQYSFFTKGYGTVLNVKMSISKFDVLDSSVNKQIKSRSVLSLLDIISLLCIRLGVNIDEFKRVCKYNTLFKYIEDVKALSLELIKLNISNEESAMILEKNVSYNLQSYTILSTLNDIIIDVSSIISEVTHASKPNSIDSTLYYLMMNSTSFTALLDALEISASYEYTDIFKCLCGNVWSLYNGCLGTKTSNDRKIFLINMLDNYSVFKNIGNVQQKRENIFTDTKATNVINALNDKDNVVELYKNLNEIRNYSIVDLFQLINKLIKLKDYHLASIVDDALTRKIKPKDLSSLKNIPLSDLSSKANTLTLVNVAKFYHQINNNSNLFEIEDITKLIEPFKVEIIRTNIFDEFKKQRDIQSCAKFAGIKGKNRVDKDVWRKMIASYVIDSSSILKLIIFFDNVNNDLESTLTVFMDNKINLVGIMTNIFMFYFSYYEYETSMEHKLYLSADSFPKNIDKVRDLMDIIMRIYCQIADTYAEPINENLYTLNAFVKYYQYLTEETTASGAKNTLPISIDDILKLIFKSFSLEYIWYVVLECVMRGNKFIDCLNLIIKGFKILDEQSQLRMVDFLLKRRDINDKLITYNYTKEIDHYLKLTSFKTVFELIFDIMLMQTNKWKTDNQGSVKEYFQIILSSVQLDVYDFMYSFIKSKLTDMTKKIASDASNRDRHVDDLQFVLEISYFMSSLNHVNSYLLNKKFTTDILEVDNSITKIDVYDTKLNNISALNWKIISQLCDHNIGLRKLISGVRSDKIYVEDMPIETHLINIFGLIFASVEMILNKPLDGSAERVAECKLDVVQKILNNSQGKNVFQQFCVSNKNSKLLAHVFSSFESCPLIIKLKLVDILCDFKKMKDFKNMYLLDKLISVEVHNDTASLVADIEILIERLKLALDNSKLADGNNYNIHKRILMLNDISTYLADNKSKVLKNVYKVPKLTFNNEMPEDIVTRFLLFKANKFYDNDFKSDVKSHIKHYDFTKLSKELIDRAKGTNTFTMLPENYFKTAELTHHADNTSESRSEKLSSNRTKISKNGSYGLLTLHALDSKFKHTNPIKVGSIVVTQEAVKRKEPERKVSNPVSEPDREAVNQHSSRIIPHPSQVVPNNTHAFINHQNTPTNTYHQPIEQNGGSLLLKNLTPNSGSNKQIANTNMSMFDMNNANMAFMSQMMPNMPQFNFMPGAMMANPAMNQFPTFMNPMMPNIVPNIMPNMAPPQMIQPNPADNLLNKRQPQEYYDNQHTGNYNRNNNASNRHNNSYGQQHSQASYNQGHDNNNNRHRQHHGNRNRNHGNNYNNNHNNRRDRISPELDKVEFSDDDHKVVNHRSETPPRQEPIDDVDDNTMQFLKKLRRNRN